MSKVKDKKQYKWGHNTYIESKGIGTENCDNCAFQTKGCHLFKEAYNLGFCGGTERIFIEKPKETLETVMAKGERIANSIMGFNSFTSKPKNTKEFLDSHEISLSDLPRMPIKADKFIVSLLENDMLEPSTNPKIHDSIESAEKEAERLCRLHNQEFVVLKVTASFKPQQPKKEVFA